MAAGGTVAIGFVRRAHGLKGFVVLRPLDDRPDDRFVPGASFTTDEDPPRTVVVAETRPHRDGLLARFEDVSDRDQAEGLRGVTLTIPASEMRNLDPDEYWERDLVGLVAVDVAGRRLGVVTGIVPGAAQDRLVVTTEPGAEVEVPFVAAIVGEVMLDEGTIVIDAPPGLF